MGNPLPTGIPNEGHSMRFEYSDQGKQGMCYLCCECGWRAEIKSYRQSWSLLEINFKAKRHFESLRRPH